MLSFIPATGRTLHVVGVWVNRIGKDRSLRHDGRTTGWLQVAHSGSVWCSAASSRGRPGRRGQDRGRDRHRERKGDIGELRQGYLHVNGGRIDATMTEQIRDLVDGPPLPNELRR